MHVDRVSNRNSKPAYLLRETWRENGKVQKQTLANLSHLPDHEIQAVRLAFRGFRLASLTPGAPGHLDVVGPGVLVASVQAHDLLRVNRRRILRGRLAFPDPFGR